MEYGHCVGLVNKTVETVGSTVGGGGEVTVTCPGYAHTKRGRNEDAGTEYVMRDLENVPEDCPPWLRLPTLRHFMASLAELF
ncbi:hypothetical protein BaRGS_00025313 [Batillaria attramentaria]|uniref:Uncharacterized protein n=1 Tax=Batillaria attramentaria TaxID=370345 RepID=A0ABD0K8G3_9CAEN